MYGNRRVTKHGFRARCGYHQMARAIAERVAEVPHVASFFLVFDFKIGNRGVELWVPVDQTLAPIDQAFIKQADKGGLYGPGQAFVHGETFP